MRINPGAIGLFRTALKQNPYDGKEDGYWDAAKANASRLLPTVNFVKDLIHPPTEPGMYPEDQTRLGRIKRQSRSFPFAVDPQKALESRQRILGDVSPVIASRHLVIEVVRAGCWQAPGSGNLQCVARCGRRVVRR